MGLHPQKTRFVLSSIAVLFFAACADEPPTTSPEQATEGGIEQPTGNFQTPTSVTCTANVLEGSLSCDDVPVVSLKPNGEFAPIILGGQNQFVRLISSAVSYADPIFQADVQVQNLISQGIGTSDGLTGTGLNVFFHTAPVVTSGTGVVTVANPDGMATFTAANQPFFFYSGYLPPPPPFSVIFLFSAVKTWMWNVPNSVGTFTFEVFVDTDIENGSGFVSMVPGAMLLATNDVTAPIAGTALDEVGRVTGSPVTFTSLHPSVATVDLNTGVVTAIGPGVADIIGSTGGPEADGLTRVTVDPPKAGFDIDLNFIGAITANQQLAFTNAAARWESLITGDLAEERVTFPPVLCAEGLDQWVDDIKINVQILPLDGVGGVLGSGGPCWPRLAGPNAPLPALGLMRFDVADVPALELNNQFEDVVLHEMAHVLGFGTFWIDLGFLKDDSGPMPPTTLADCPDTPLDPFFDGPTAITAFGSAPGAGTYVGNEVPVEDMFGAGTRCGHWREPVMTVELLTGFIEAPGTAMPLSEVSVKSFGDLGYTVAGSGWDAWTCTGCAPPPPGAPAIRFRPTGLQLVNDIWLGPMYGRNAQGEVVLVVPDRRR